MNEDFLDLLRVLLDEGARFLIVGAHAMAVHGVPRATGDLDLWVEPDPGNAQKVWSALLRFGAPVEGLELSQSELAVPGTVVQIGLPPRRIDLLTSVTGLHFEQAWKSRRVQDLEKLELPFLGREELIRNKRAVGRAKDLADLEILESGSGG